MCFLKYHYEFMNFSIVDVSIYCSYYADWFYTSTSFFPVSMALIIHLLYPKIRQPFECCFPPLKAATGLKEWVTKKWWQMRETISQKKKISITNAMTPVLINIMTPRHCFWYTFLWRIGSPKIASPLWTWMPLSSCKC